MKTKDFIQEISRRFPEHYVITVLGAIATVKNTEYEHIFSEEIEEEKRKLQFPTDTEIQQEMELHNADEVGIDNQWSFDDAEYYLLLSDKYNN